MSNLYLYSTVISKSVLSFIHKPDQQQKILKLDLAFNNVKPNDWYFALIRFELG